jgi:hypothetical protein
MYGKLFAHMYDGTLATKGPWQALVTFQQMLILCDKEGVIDMTAEAIARRTTIPLEIIEIGIPALEEIDPDSRSPELEGRRIVRLSENRPWGWQIVNYAKYRKIRSDEERKEYMRNYQREYRKQTVNTGKQSKQVLAMSTNSSKQYAVSRSNKNQVPALSDEETAEKIPIIGGEFPISKSYAKELEGLYPSVDVPQTLREIRGWNLANPTKRKTASGVLRHVNSWLAKEQNHG